MKKLRAHALQAAVEQLFVKKESTPTFGTTVAQACLLNEDWCSRIRKYLDQFDIVESAKGMSGYVVLRREKGDKVAYLSIKDLNIFAELGFLRVLRQEVTRNTVSGFRPNITESHALYSEFMDQLPLTKSDRLKVLQINLTNDLFGYGTHVACVFTETLVRIIEVYPNLEELVLRQSWRQLEFNWDLDNKMVWYANSVLPQLKEVLDNVDLPFKVTIRSRFEVDDMMEQGHLPLFGYQGFIPEILLSMGFGMSCFSPYWPASADAKQYIVWEKEMVKNDKVDFVATIVSISIPEPSFEDEDDSEDDVAMDASSESDPDFDPIG